MHGFQRRVFLADLTLPYHKKMRGKKNFLTLQGMERVGARYAVLPMAAVLLAAVLVMLHSRSAVKPEPQLYQIGDQEFLSMNTGCEEMEDFYL
jgi:hypothetical protein